MKRVVIYYKFLPHYRADFFENLKVKLNQNNIELVLLYGKLRNNKKNDEVILPWATPIANHFIRIFGVEFIWQSGLSFIQSKDLVIVEQASKLLINYWFVIFRKLLKIKFAYWGHGLDMQKDKGDINNQFKKRILKYCDWWFAYTEGCKKIIVDNDFPSNKITVVQNSIDTQTLNKYFKEIGINELQELRGSLGINEGDRVGIYCGSLYKEKRITFLLEAIQLIKKQVPTFHFIFIGSGIDANLIEEFAKENSYVHYVGNQFDREKTKYFKISELFLMPGLVGLAILDAFALQTPMITTTYPYHSPEIEYLETGKNGLITPNTLEGFVDGVVKTLDNRELLARLVKGCEAATAIYTVDKMVDNVYEGIMRCFNISND